MDPRTQRIANNLALNEATKAAGGFIAAPSVTQSSTPAPTPGVGGAITRNGSISQDGVTAITPDVIGTQAIRIPQVGTNQAQERLSVTSSQALVPPPEPPKNEIDATRQRIAEIAGIQATEGDFRLQAQEDVQLAEKRQRLADINARALRRNESYDKKVQEIRDNAQGNFGGAVAQNIERLERERSQELGRIAIEQAVAQGNVEAALATVKDVVDAKFEPLKNEIATRKTILDLLKDDLTESEMLQAQAKIREDEAKVNVNRDAYLTAASLLAEARAPQEAFAVLDRTADNPSATPASILASISSYSPLSKEEKEARLAQEQAKEAIPALEDKKMQLQDLISDTVGMSSAVGPNRLYRKDPSDFITGARGNFIAGVQQIISRETLDTLINLKAQGGTLGALSDGERLTLESAASKIGTWAIKDGDGKVTGYKTTEKAFKQELETIKRLTERAINKAYGFNMSNEELLNSIPSTITNNQEFFNQY